jgi:hypothetical protein
MQVAPVRLNRVEGAVLSDRQGNKVMRDIHSILADRALLDLIEHLDAVRSLHETADHNVHIAILVDNALREVAGFLVQLREERLNGGLL